MTTNVNKISSDAGGRDLNVLTRLLSTYIRINTIKGRVIEIHEDT